MMDTSPDMIHGNSSSDLPTASINQGRKNKLSCSMGSQSCTVLGVRHQLIIAVYVCMLLVDPAEGTLKRWFCDSYSNTSPNTGICPLCISACAVSHGFMTLSICLGAKIYDSLLHIVSECDNCR